MVDESLDGQQAIRRGPVAQDNPVSAIIRDRFKTLVCREFCSDNRNGGVYLSTSLFEISQK